MGNEQSSQSNKNIEDLQKQLLENQLKIQQIQLNNLQNSQNNNYNQNGQNTQNDINYLKSQNSLNLNAIFTNPTLQEQISKNPRMKHQLLNKILTEYKDSLTENQILKINQMLLETHKNDVKKELDSMPFMNHNIGTQNYNKSNRNVQTSKDNYYLETLQNNYKSQEEEDEARFKFEEEKRRQQFREQQKQRRFEYQSKLQQLEKDNVNALKLFQLPDNFNMNDLKHAYKKLAIRTHPDRPKGSKEKFQVVTKCYFALIEKLKRNEKEKSFDKLRNDSRDYWEERHRDSMKNVNNKNNNGLINPNDKNFNIKVFNKIFEEYKLYDPNDEGYEDWLKESDDTPQPKVFSNKFNIDVFNSTFNNYKDNNQSSEIIEYKEPQAMISTNKMNYSDIDNYSKKEFTKTQEGRDDLLYSDLKSAYTKSTLINPNNVNIKTYKNIDHYEHERNNISYTMTQEQLQQVALENKKKEYEEQQRLKRIQQQDALYENNYNKLHQRMISFNN